MVHNAEVLTVIVYVCMYVVAPKEGPKANQCHELWSRSELLIRDAWMSLIDAA